jgi:hypothetical protein
VHRDVKYMEFRAMVRDPAWQQQVPGHAAGAAQGHHRRPARRQPPGAGRKSYEIMDVTPQAIADVFARPAPTSSSTATPTAPPCTRPGGTASRRYVLPDWELEPVCRPPAARRLDRHRRRAQGFPAGRPRNITRASGPISPITLMMRMVSVGRASYMFVDREDWEHFRQRDQLKQLAVRYDLPGMPAGLRRHIVCSRDVPAETMNKLNQAIAATGGMANPGHSGKAK